MDSEGLTGRCGRVARRCGEVSLDAFIDCLVNGNLKRLVIEGEVSEEALQAAWSALYNEYAELSGNTAHAYLFSLMKTTAVLRAKLVLVQQFLQSGEVGLLQKLGYPGDVKKIVARAKYESIELQGKEKELEKARQSSEKDGAKESDFTVWIVSVSKYMGFRIDRHTVSVAEFLTMNKIMVNELEAKAKQMKKC
jgi:hypothetical protein